MWTRTTLATYYLMAKLQTILHARLTSVAPARGQVPGINGLHGFRRGITDGRYYSTATAD